MLYSFEFNNNEKSLFLIILKPDKRMKKNKIKFICVCVQHRIEFNRKLFSFVFKISS